MSPTADFTTLPGETLNQCLQCGKCLSSKWALSSHETIHAEERAYKCPHCDKSFSGKHLLRTHVKHIHEKVKDFTCDICWKSFFTKASLEVQKLTHSGVKPHACLYCGYTCTTKGDITRHVKQVHEKVKPHSCDVSDKTFTFKGDP